MAHKDGYSFLYQQWLKEQGAQVGNDVLFKEFHGVISTQHHVEYPCNYCRGGAMDVDSRPYEWHRR